LLQSSEHQNLKAAIANCFRTPLQVKIPGFATGRPS